MSDVITKFKLETTQYDSKLRDATDRMKDLMRAVQVAGGSMNDLSAKDKEGHRLETVEISTKTWRVLQSRGLLNRTTPFHDQIVRLVEQNIGLFKKVA